jgi:hypothetical protein
MITVPDGCELVRPRFRGDGSLTVVSCNGGDPAGLEVFRLVDTNRPMTMLFDLQLPGEGHATDQIISFDWNDAGTEALFQEQTGHVYRWNATDGIVEIPTTASAVGY